MSRRVSAKVLLSFFGSFVLPILLTISGCGGGKSQVAAVQPVDPVPPVVSLIVKPASVLPGQSATLTWSTTHASSCTADGAWSGSQQLNGSINVTLPSLTTQTYTLECISDSGLAARSVATLSLSPTDGACTANHALSTAKGRRMSKQRMPNGAHS
jgi:hypothetical protein